MQRATLAKCYDISRVHLAVALLEETPSAKAGGAAVGNLLTSIVNKVCSSKPLSPSVRKSKLIGVLPLAQSGGDPQLLTRSLQRLLVRLPSQEPPPDDPSLSSQTAKVLRQAQTIMKDRSDSFISQDALILALVQADASVAGAFKECGIDEAKLKQAINDIRGSKHVDSKQAEAGYEALSKYAVDLTQLAEEGKLDPVIGRDNEIRRCIRVLSRRTKNNPVLIGEPGVGKSAIAEGLASRIVNRDVPANLLARLFSLDMGALMAGASCESLSFFSVM